MYAVATCVHELYMCSGVPTQEIITSGSGSADETLDSDEAVKWWMWVIVGVTLVLVLCLTCSVLVAVRCTCICRSTISWYVCGIAHWPCDAITCRKRCRSHQTGDYAIMDNLDSGVFHSIPYRQDGLPECPIYHSLGKKRATCHQPGNFTVTTFFLSLSSLSQQEKWDQQIRGHPQSVGRPRLMWLLFPRWPGITVQGNRCQCYRLMRMGSVLVASLC